MAWITLLSLVGLAVLCNAHHGRPIDCFEELQQHPNSTTGIYTIYPRSRVIRRPIQVKCDMHFQGGGWTMIQRRGDFGKPANDFLRDWHDYKHGFGDLTEDFWIGNDIIFALTNQRASQLRIGMSDFEGNVTYANYRNFWTDDEHHNYTLHVAGYTGNAGDSLGPVHNGRPFSTYERSHCAEYFKGAWWYNACHTSNLNGLYLRGPHESFADGVNWLSFRGYRYSLKDIYMGVRPTGFDPKP